MLPAGITRRQPEEIAVAIEEVALRTSMTTATLPARPPGMTGAGVSSTAIVSIVDHLRHNNNHYTSFVEEMGFLSKEHGRLETSENGSRRLPVPDYVAFDLETTGLSPDDDEILEVAFVRFQDGEPVERWSTLVNPMRHVPLKALRLTHIDIRDIEESPVFGDISGRIVKMCESLPLVGHNASFDTAFLAKRIAGFPGVPVYDTLELSRIVVPGYKSYKLSELARAFGISLQDAHRAYDDAEVAGKIFALIQKHILKLGRHLREAVVSIMGDDWGSKRLFFFEPDGPAMLPLISDPAPIRLDLRAGEPCPEDPYDQRTGAPGEQAIDSPEGQTRLLELNSSRTDTFGRLSRRFVQILDSPDPGGLALGVPLVSDTARAVAQAARDWARRTGKKVLLAGFPEAFLPDDIPRAANPENYICVRKFSHAARLATQGFLKEIEVEDRRFLASLSVWVHSNGSGQLGEIQVIGRAYGVRNELCCPKEMTCRSSCPEKDLCRYLLAEKESDVSPVQRATLDGALAMSGGFDRVIVWGAHDLHRIRQYREERVDLAALKEILTSENASSEVPALERLSSLASKDLSTGRASTETKKWAAEAGTQLMGAARTIRHRLEGQFGFLTSGEPKWEGRPDPPIVSAALHHLEKASQALASISRDSCEHIAVVEASYGDETKGPFLTRRSIWPARDAVRSLGSLMGAPILLSDVAMQAGATHGGRSLFLGVESPVVSLWSEFQEGGAVPELLVSSVDVKAAASGPAFTKYACGFLRALALRVRSGLLVLFSSRAQVRDVYALLSPELEREGIVVYAQGIDGGRAVLEHLNEEDSVVLASNWVFGECDPVPTCLTVMRIPFPPPNPVDDARRKELSGSGSDGFVEVSVRPPSLMVRAYAERMLARGGKRALVLADPRLSPGASRWASEFFRSLDGLARECGPVEYLLNRVSRHLFGES